MKNLYLPYFFTVLLSISIVGGLLAQAAGEGEMRLIEVPVKENRDANIASMIVAKGVNTLAAGIPSQNPDSSGRVVYFQKTGQASNFFNAYGYVEFAPPETGQIEAFTIVNDERILVQTISGPFPSYGEEIALSQNGFTLAVAAPDFEINPGVPVGAVFVYDLRNYNTGATIPEPRIFTGSVFGNVEDNTAIPGFGGFVENFGRSLALNHNGQTLTVGGRLVSSSFQGGESPSAEDRGVVFFIRPNNPLVPPNFNPGDLLTSPNVYQGITYLPGEGGGFGNDAGNDGYGDFLSMSDAGQGSALIGAPRFDESFLGAVNPGGGGLAFLVPFGDDQDISDVGFIEAFFSAPTGGGYNQPGNDYGTISAINRGAGRSLIGGDGPEGFKVWFYDQNVDPDPTLFVTPLAELTSGGVQKVEFGAAVDISQIANAAIVTDPSWKGKGMGYYYNLTDAEDFTPNAENPQPLDPYVDPDNPFLKGYINPIDIARETPSDGKGIVRGFQRLGWNKTIRNNIERQFEIFSLLFQNATEFGRTAGIDSDGSRFGFSAETTYAYDEAILGGELNPPPPEDALYPPGTTDGTVLNSHLILSFDLAAFLPVELVSFTATPEGESVRLDWETATETNNLGFTIQRSYNAVDWENLGWMDGQGNSTTPKSYRFYDSKPYNGINYYRLETKDYDGALAYSDVVSAKIEVSLENLNVYPVPFRDNLTVVTPDNMPVIMAVYDMFGRKVFQQEYLDGYKELPLQDLATGTYVLRIMNGKEIIHTQKIIKGR